MRIYLLLIILFFGACAEDSRELTRPNIERWIKKDKLHKYIDETYFVDTLKELLTILTEEEKAIYADLIAKKEQELRFPRPTPMTIEYLDSITNQSVMNEAKKYRDEVDLSLKDQNINDRLEFFEDRFNYALGGEAFGTNDYYTIFYDPIDDLYYRGTREITNGFEFELNQDTNNIDITTRDVLVHVTNLSPSNRLYLNIDTGDQLFMTLTQVYDRFYIPEALSENFSDYKLVRYIETDTNNSFYGKSNVFIYQNSQGQEYPNRKDPNYYRGFLYFRDGFDGIAISFYDFSQFH
ncbi:MAG: hypothetical protein ACRCV0_02090 [Brevinema sp.]